MRIDFSTVLLTVDGDRLVDGGKPVTLKKIAVDALMAVTDDDKSITGEEKVSRYTLARKISANPDRSMKVEDVALIKKLIAKIYGPVVVGPAWAILDGESQIDPEATAASDDHVPVNGMAN